MQKKEIRVCKRFVKTSMSCLMLKRIKMIFDWLIHSIIEQMKRILGQY